MNRDEVLGQIGHFSEIAKDGDVKGSLKGLDALKETVKQNRGLGEDLIEIIENREETIRNTTSKIVQEAKDELEQILENALSSDDAILRVDIANVNRLINRMERADINTAYKNNINDFKDQRNQIDLKQTEERFINKVIADIEKLWQEATELGKQNVSPATRLDKYREATKKAQQARAQYPNHIRLIAYEDRASREENRFAITTQIYTSALEFELFQNALDGLKLVPDEETVPRLVMMTSDQVDADGNQIRKFHYDKEVTASEARKELRDMASEWALKKKREYIAEVELLLSQHKPKEADAKLDDTKKLEDFLEVSDQREINDLRQKIATQLDLLHQAETKAEDAQKQVEINPRAAWLTLKDAEKLHANSEKINTIRQTITDSLRERVKSIQKDATDAINRDDFTALRDCKTRADDYNDIDDPSVRAIITEVTRLFDDGEKLRSNRQTAQSEFDIIKQMSQQNARDALKRLRDLKQTYNDDRVFSEITGFKQLHDELEAEIDLKTVLDSHEAHISSTNLREVNESIMTLTTLKERHKSNAKIKTLLADLEFTQMFLRARNELDAGERDEALKLAKQVARQSHPFANDAQRLQTDIENQKSEIEQFSTRLQEAKGMVLSDPQEAIEILDGLPIQDLTLNTQKHQIRKDAENELTRTIVRELTKAYDLWQSIQHGQIEQNAYDESLVKVPSHLEKLQKLGRSQEYQQWYERFKLLLLLDEARRFSFSDDPTVLDRAIKPWDEIIELATKQSSTRLEDYRIDYRDMQRKRIDRKLRRARSHSDSTQKTGELEKLKSELEKATSQFTDDPMLAYYRADLMGLLAAMSLRDRARHDNYRQMEQDANMAYDLMLEHPLSNDLMDKVRKLKEEAETITSVISHMDRVDANMSKPSVKSLSQALQTWKETIEPKITSDSSSLYDWWENLKNETLQQLKISVNQNKNKNEIQIDEINTYAMVFVLEQNNLESIEMFNQLPDLANKLGQSVSHVVADLPTAQGVHGYHPVKETKIDLQIENLNALQKQLDAIDQIANLFSSIHTIGNSTMQTNVETAQNSLDNSVTSLNDAIRRAKDFQERLTAFTNQVDDDSTRALPQTLQDKPLIDQINLKYQESDKLLLQMSDFDTHPDFIEASEFLQQEKDNFGKMQTQLQSIFQSITDGQYQSALRQMNTVQQGDIVKYGLKGTINVQIKDTTYREWDKLEGAIKLNAGELSTLLVFTDPFDAVSITGVPSTDEVVSWERVEAQIKRFIQEGEFDRAGEILADALGNTESDTPDTLERTPDGQVTLSAAYMRIQHPPMIEANLSNLDSVINRSNDTTVAGRYEMAKLGATNKQAEILDFLFKERYSLYKKQYEAARQTIDTINQKEEDWHRIWSGWQREIERIAEAFARSGGINSKPQGSDRSNIHTARDRAEEYLEDCRTDFPQHPRFEEMESLRIMEYARKV